MGRPRDGVIYQVRTLRPSSLGSKGGVGRRDRRPIWPTIECLGAAGEQAYFLTRKMTVASTDQLALLRARIEGWGVLWKVPCRLDGVSLRISTRLRVSLGNYRASRNEIALAAWLLDGDEELLGEVLCHEAAHAAVHLLYGKRAKPHGAEWRGLMEQAGFTGRVRIPWSALPKSRQIETTRRGSWEHRCPRCQVARIARTRVSRWRCAACRRRGREGALVIRRLPDTVAVEG